MTAMFLLGVPLAASASSGNNQSTANANDSYVSPGLLGKADKHPNDKIRVIVTSDVSLSTAKNATKFFGDHHKNLGLVDGVALELPASRLRALSRIPGLTITPDAPVQTSAEGGNFSSKQVWPYEAGFASLWANNTDQKVPTIAVVDSGIQPGRTDFGNRVLANETFTTLPGNSPGDGRGHGTFVAGVAADSAQGYAGANPGANLVGLDVMDDTGKARTSDVIAACNWIIANKDKYNIRIANLSLHSGTPSNFTRDPLDKAVEKLWFDGVTVVAAAGNYGSATGPSGVKYAPGNDPFVITVGAVDLEGTPSPKDDVIAPWSAYGRTYDGFMKPDVSAAGRYMIGPVPAGSTLPLERPTSVVAPGYMQLSGTSFSAPVVAGAAAYILTRHPDFTPDQVKGALMQTARKVGNAAPFAAGVGQVTANRAVRVLNPPNPNKALEKYLGADPSGGSLPVFDSVSWLDAIKSDVSWDSVAWSDVAWQDVSWDSVAWQDVSWDSVAWQDLSAADVAWSDVAWNDTSYEDAAEGDSGQSDGYQMTADDIAALLADPLVAPPADTLPAVAPAPADPAPADPATAPPPTTP